MPPSQKTARKIQDPSTKFIHLQIRQILLEYIWSNHEHQYPHTHQIMRCANRRSQKHQITYSLHFQRQQLVTSASHRLWASVAPSCICSLLRQMKLEEIVALSRNPLQCYVRVHVWCFSLPLNNNFNSRQRWKRFDSIKARRPLFLFFRKNRIIPLMTFDSFAIRQRALKYISLEIEQPRPPHHSLVTNDDILLYARYPASHPQFP